LLGRGGPSRSLPARFEKNQKRKFSEDGKNQYGFLMRGNQIRSLESGEGDTEINQ
jgi:hypothetical protein